MTPPGLFLVVKEKGKKTKDKKKKRPTNPEKSVRPIDFGEKEKDAQTEKDARLNELTKPLCS